jgi:hypothetical protein
MNPLLMPLMIVCPFATQYEMAARIEDVARVPMTAFIRNLVMMIAFTHPTQPPHSNVRMIARTALRCKPAWSCPTTLIDSDIFAATDRSNAPAMRPVMAASAIIAVIALLATIVRKLATVPNVEGSRRQKTTISTIMA